MKSIKELAVEALKILRPSIDELLKQAKRQHIHIVVMNPQVKPWEAKFTEAIAYEESITDGKKWEHPYDQIARSKAEQEWRDNNGTNLITQLLAPAMLRDGYTLFYGSWSHYGQIVSCSGVEPWYDTLISMWLSTTIQQLAQHELQCFRLANPKAIFLPKTAFLP